MTTYDPASREARNGILLWILETHYLGTLADPSLLAIGLPQRPIRRAEVQDDGSIKVWIRDQTKPHEERPRFFDAPSFAALRLLCLSKAHLLFSRTDQPPRRALHYLTFADHIQVTRIIADAPPGQDAEIGGEWDGAHRMLCRSNLRILGGPTGPTKNLARKGRKLAIQTAVTNLEKSTDDFGLTPQEYDALLRLAFRLVDRMPLASGDEAA